MATPIPAEGRAALIASALGLEMLTVGWLVVEAVLALVAASRAGSLTLLAFGMDSLIELASAAMLLWRLHIELRQGAEFSEAIEHRAARIGAALLLALALYVAASAAWTLWAETSQQFSALGPSGKAGGNGSV